MGTRGLNGAFHHLIDISGARLLKTTTDLDYTDEIVLLANLFKNGVASYSTAFVVMNHLEQFILESLYRNFEKEQLFSLPSDFPKCFLPAFGPRRKHYHVTAHGGVWSGLQQ